VQLSVVFGDWSHEVLSGSSIEAGQDCLKLYTITNCYISSNISCSVKSRSRWEDHSCLCIGFHLQFTILRAHKQLLKDSNDCDILPAHVKNQVPELRCESDAIQNGQK